ncbi:MAG: cobyric acid synthase [Rhodospirillaceae bacterium]|jgi:adenosylcobyric acid synthase|nr:cobyric acid synthase [Rhodospirillaceae bacterium]MBT3928951.1 cobyric acid synthase [Rhodospirillaceae bacterium]MBT4426416.1 cobyric acid synthase [Rhodospirillaceae bacterium]MBT5038148.1 cobyric acid synthase [Rhodospirillaceae bacterium]MBT5676726.1 cobyric acid synthase [Rhodospirillaceae bacterium]
MTRTASLMLQGTGSHVGKSLLVAGLCRAYRNRGLEVRPFKAQNMSNNAAVTESGAEIGRAQALQARAAGVAPSTDMNPVLLKPESETGAQVIVQGKVSGHANARAYHELKPRLMPAVLESFERLSEEADIVLVEGAGSPAEVNLRHGDIANMGFALAAQVPVVLIGDIERGGVIASLIGTAQLLEAEERALIKGCVVNKFRGDPSLFDDAIPVIEQGLGAPCLGVVPYFAKAGLLPAEDAVSLDGAGTSLVPGGARAIRIAVPRLPRIANFDDFDPLRAEADVDLVIVEPGRALPGDADLVLLPGSKSTRADLAELRAQGWDIDIQGHLRRGGSVLGLCGGYQMLGQKITDPDGVEGEAGISEGLGLLDVDTVLSGDKRLEAVSGRELASGEDVHGYEMHMGMTAGPDTVRPMLALAHGQEGACSADGKVSGSYVHGLFAADGFRHAFLSRLAARGRSPLAWEVSVDETLDGLARHLEDALDLDRILEIARAA